MPLLCNLCTGMPDLRRQEYSYCRRCDYWFSSLDVDVENTEAPAEEYELVSYEFTRTRNYRTIIRRLGDLYPGGSRLLEIGCAEGLFLKLARESLVLEAVGVEPNTRMMQGNPHGQDIRRGFFPEAIAGERQRGFDYIVLNCTFEHMPHLHTLLENLKGFLRPRGVLAINIPVASGLMFRVGRLLHRFGVTYPFDRLWQKGFVSPHLHYFSRKSLCKLFARHSMPLLAEQSLELFSLGGIYARLSLDSRMKRLQKLGITGLLYLYYPLSRLLPDARVFYFGGVLRKEPEQPVRTGTAGPGQPSPLPRWG